MMSLMISLNQCSVFAAEVNLPLSNELSNCPYLKGCVIFVLPSREEQDVKDRNAELVMKLVNHASTTLLIYRALHILFI